MNIQWFPGHMAKARKLVSENLKFVDVVIEILDARIPYSSKNPEIDKILKSKPRIVAFNKADLADEKISREWGEWYGKKGFQVVFLDAVRGKGVNRLKSLIAEMTKDKLEREKQKGKVYRPVRTMVVGITNVGKSTLINTIAGKARAATGDRPGVTRQKQWVRLDNGIEMLDMPGILWPKFDDPRVGLNLAFTGAIKDDVIDMAEVAARLMVKLYETYPELLKSRYKLGEDLIDTSNLINDTFSMDKPGNPEKQDNEILLGYKLLERAGRNRGCLVGGGNVDFNRIASIVLDEFRGGKIGRISLEKPSTS
ncbi:MAG: ribosome biogenesis GTPase YlqF [Clostridiaceae bacterium]|nr:ribosome biogenesis GTPase YlqF [Clostridiaceae bacterium]